jgi:hypothetical protein
MIPHAMNASAKKGESSSLVIIIREENPETIVAEVLENWIFKYLRKNRNKN